MTFPPGKLPQDIFVHRINYRRWFSQFAFRMMDRLFVAARGDWNKYRSLVESDVIPYFRDEIRKSIAKLDLRSIKLASVDSSCDQDTTSVDKTIEITTAAEGNLRSLPIPIVAISASRGYRLLQINFGA